MYIFTSKNIFLLLCAQILHKSSKTYIKFNYVCLPIFIITFVIYVLG